MNLTYTLRGLLFVLIFFPLSTFSQNILNQRISIQVTRKKLKVALDEISEKHNFLFSYNSGVVPTDSIVSFQYSEESLKKVLTHILGNDFDFSESKNYIIITKKEITVERKTTIITGQVIDARNDSAIENASIYLPNELLSILSDEHGSFKLKTKENNSNIIVRASKEFYLDTFLIVNTTKTSFLHIKLFPQKIGEFEPISISNNHVEKTWLGNIFLSSKQIIQSVNIKDFFVNKPYQMSFIPKFGTHGKMSGQIKNKISLNMIGGYAAATHGVELGGMFNIIKQDVNGTQVAGIFNIVGEQITGVQLAGIYNQGLNTMKGVQIAGIWNHQKGYSIGVQLSGIWNTVNDSMRGVQLAGVYNNTPKSMHGFQMSAIWNKTKDLHGMQFSSLLNQANGMMKGTQLSFVANYASEMEGVQIGLINIADSSKGYSFGLVNIGKNYRNSWSVQFSELPLLSLGYRSGNPKLYNIFLLGIGLNNENNFWSVGYGLGKEVPITHKIFFTPELTVQALTFSKIKKTTTLYRLQPAFKWKLAKHLAIRASPSISAWHYSNSLSSENSPRDLSQNGLFPFKIGKEKIWVGGELGLEIF